MPIIFHKIVTFIFYDLNLLDNFEKVLCYQYPGVFSDPSSDFRVGEAKTIKLFEDYLNYLNNLEESKNILKN